MQANNYSWCFAKLDRHYIVTMLVLLLLIRNVAKNLRPITKHSNTTPKCSTPKLLFIVNIETCPFLWWWWLLLLSLSCRATKLLFLPLLLAFLTHQGLLWNLQTCVILECSWVIAWQQDSVYPNVVKTHLVLRPIYENVNCGFEMLAFNLSFSPKTHIL